MMKGCPKCGNYTLDVEVPTIMHFDGEFCEFVTQLTTAAKDAVTPTSWASCDAEACDWVGTWSELLVVT